MDQTQFCFKCGYAVDTPNHERGCLGQSLSVGRLAEPGDPLEIDEEPEERCIESAKDWRGDFVQCCLPKGHTASEAPEDHLAPEGWREPPEDAVQDGLPDGLVVTADGRLLNWRGENYVRQHEPGASLEVLTGFIVAVGRNGRPMVLPLDLRGVTLDTERDADNRDIQAACREISDDLLAHRAAEYSDNAANVAAVADILGELAARIPEDAPAPVDPNIERFRRRRGQQ